MGVDLNAATPAGLTLAHNAASNGHDGCLRVLHELGANINAASANGKTPAFDAAWHGHDGCLRVLHELGVDLNAATPDGRTPADVAVSNANSRCVSVLRRSVHLRARHISSLEWTTDTHHLFVEEDKLLVRHIVLTLALL